MLQLNANVEGPTFGLTADVSKAHRRFKHAKEDWGYLACQLDDNRDEVWLNKVGTFGIGCAFYFWARLFGILHALLYQHTGAETSMAASVCRRRSLDCQRS